MAHNPQAPHNAPAPHQDNAGSTQMFQAFVDEEPPQRQAQPAAGNRTGLIAGVVAGAVVLVVVLAVVLL